MKRIYTILCAALSSVCAATAQESTPRWTISLGEGAFRDSQIETIDYIVTGEIGKETFANCNSLKGLTVSDAQPAPCAPSAFWGVDMSDKQLRVLAEPGVASLYREAAGWGMFGDIYSQYFTLQVYMKDGSMVNTLFDYHPCLTFDTEMNVFFTSDEQSLTWKLSDVERIERKTIEAHTMGTPIQAVGADRPVFSLHNGQLTLSRAAGTFCLHSLDGKQMGSATADEQGNASFNLRSLPAGIYVASDGQHSIKVINK